MASDDQTTEAVRDLLDAIKGLLDWVKIDKLPMDKDALHIAHKAIAKAEAVTNA